MGAIRSDGYMNAFTGAGMMGRDPFAATRFWHRNNDWFANMREADDFFTGNGLAQRIITAPAEEALRVGWDIESCEMDKEQEEMLKSLCEDLNIKDALSLALSWDRLFGGAAILMLANDGGRLDEPLNEETLKSIERLDVFSPQDVSYTSAGLYDNPTDPNYGKPEFYNVIGKWGNAFVVHESRLLMFYGQPISNEKRRMRNGWGGSILEQVRDELVRLGSSFDAARMAIERLSQSVLKFNSLAQKMMHEDGENEVMRRLHMIDMGRHLLNTIAIDTDEDYTQHNVSISGLREVLEEFEIAVSSATGIPMTILFGRSPAGMSATGKSDLESYYNMVERIQERILRPQLSRLVYLLSKCSNNEIELPEHWEIEFEPLWNPTKKEKAETHKLNADARKADADAMNTLMQMGALDLQEVRDTLFEESDYKIDQSLDKLLSKTIE